MATMNFNVQEEVANNMLAIARANSEILKELYPDKVTEGICIKENDYDRQ